MTERTETRPSTRDHAVAFLACIAVSLLLLYPLAQGQMLFGGGRSDMFIAGYAFRRFGAETFLNTGHIPQWNPYLFGGLPYIGAMHGDIFYPTAWLRWILPVDVAITWGMVIHFVLAGWLLYRFAVALGLSWGAALIGGVAYELTGIVASQMSPGHDGKLFVSALAPLAFWTLLVAIRGRRMWAYGAFAVEVALIVLGHYHMAYFLLLALGLWALYLALWDSERPADQPAWKPLALSAAAVAVGVGITALQVLPFLSYIPYSPRAEGGSDTGWQFATSYAMPPAEIFTLLLPEFNGVLDQYWGSNPIKFHTEYVGALPLVLAALAWTDATRRRLALAFTLGAVFFLLFAFAGHTPFYKPFFELLPGLKKIRAMGMVFYLTAFSLSILAAMGADALFAQRVKARTVLALGGGVVLFALLGAVGGLQPLAEGLAIPERAEAVFANAAALKAGAVRLLGFAVVGTLLLWATAMRKLPARVAVIALVTATGLELWSVDRRFFNWSPRASQLFADDAVTTYLRKAPKPYRVLDGQDSYGKSILMGYDIPQLTGYHGFQLKRFNDLMFAEQGLSPSMLDLYAVRYLILQGEQNVPGFKRVVPPTPTALGTTAVLYERETPTPWARVVPAAAKAPDAQIPATVTDARFPVNGAVLLSDSARTTLPAAAAPFAPSASVATVSDWRAGAMKVSVAPAATAPSMLVVAENWFPDWQATVNGKTVSVTRVDHALLGVELPAGASEVTLTFDSPTYRTGKIISLVALLVALGMWLVPLLTASRGPGAARAG
ncbi:MAG: YfhO family protein [Gemmatimonadaceae bacterium]|nr:YfhO family protein [Gemmatimonadaceae bacterium]